MKNTLLILVAAGLAALSAGCGEREELGVFGETKALQVVIMEDHSDLLLEWLRRGYSGMRVLHVDTHDDCRVSDAAAAAKAQALARGGDWQALADGSGVAFGAETEMLFNIGDFLHAGWRMGVVKELVWLLPGQAQDIADIEKVREWLGVIGFDAESVASFEMVDGFPKGLRAGLPVTICTADKIPASDEPTLVSLDIDYFMRTYRGSQDAPGLQTATGLFESLRAARIRTPLIGISYSVHGGSIPLELRYLGDELAGMLSRASAEPMVAWTERQAALDALNTGAFPRARELFEELVAADPSDASSFYSLAQVALLEGDDLAPVFEALERARQANPVFFIGFVELSYWVRTDPRFQGRDQDGLIEGLLAESMRTYAVQHENGDHATLGVSYFEMGDFRHAQIEHYRLVEEVKPDALAGFTP